MSPYSLLLFDIDGTLLYHGGAVAYGMQIAMKTAFGTKGRMDGHPFGGKTDPQIVKELMLLEGFTDQEIDARFPLFCEEYVKILKQSIASFQLNTYPGVIPLLTALSSRPGPILGLLTGNLQGIVAPKLRAAGIPPEIFVLGAYGSDHADRNKLPGIAISRAQDYLQHPIDKQSVLIIGDTPYDIRCARAGGTRVMAVATGEYSLEQLAEHHPDYLLKDLADTDAVLQILTTS
jgi:phosphoglycolate phosphatase